MRKKTLIEMLADREDINNGYTNKTMQKTTSSWDNVVKTTNDIMKNGAKSSMWDSVVKTTNELMNSDMMKNINKNVVRSTSINTNPVQFIFETGTDVTKNIYNKMTTEEQRKENKNMILKSIGDTAQKFYNPKTLGHVPDINKEILYKSRDTRIENKSNKQNTVQLPSVRLPKNNETPVPIRKLANERTEQMNMVLPKIKNSEVPVPIRQNAKLPEIQKNENILISKKTPEETWGDKLSKITEKNIEDTIRYSPKIAEGIILGGKQAIENAGQYFTETVPEQTSLTYKMINYQRKKIAKEMAIGEDMNNIFNDDIGKNLFQIAKENDQEKINKIIEEAPNIVTRKLAELAASTGQTLAGTAIGIATGGAGSIVSGIYFFGASGQSYFDSAKERGMNDKDAFSYSGLMATWESASESLVTGRRVNQLKLKFTGNEFSEKAMKFIGNDVVENAIQEGLTEIVDDTVTRLTGGNEFISGELEKRVLESAFNGGLQGLLLSGITGGVTDISKGVKDFITKNGEQKTIDIFLDSAKNEIAQIESKMIEEIDNISKNAKYTTEQDVRIENNGILENKKQITQKENKMQEKAMSEQIKRKNIINEKVEEYRQNIKDNFTTDINIDTKIVSQNDLPGINYSKQKQSFLYNKAKQLFSSIKKNVFKNNNQDIYVTNSDIHKSISETVRNKEQTGYAKENVAVFSQLDKIIENAELLSSDSKDNKGRTEYSNYEYYVSKANIDGNPYIVEFDTRLQKGSTGKEERHFRLERVYPLNKKVGSVNGAENSTSHLVLEPTSVDTVDNVSTTNNIISQSEKNMQVQEKYNRFKQQLAENGLNYDDKRANVMFDLPNKRGIDIEVNSEVFKKTDRSIDSNINAMYITDAEGNRKIIYNPNANLDSIIEKNTIHEIVHDLEGTKEYSRLSKMVLDKMKNTPEFQEAYNSLKEAYSKVTDSEGRILYNLESEEFSNMIKQEAVADYLGENLGNQEYINELVNGKETRNIAQKIYDAIVSFLDKITGYKSEEAYLRGIKDKFEKAFNAEYSNSESTQKFSIQTDSQGNKYVKVDTDQDIFEGINPKDYNKIAKMYMQDYLIGKTTLANSDSTIIDSRSTRKYTNPEQNKAYLPEKMKLTPELKNVLEISQKIGNALPMKENSKYRNWEYYKFKFELDGKNFEGTINIGIDKNGNKHFYEINKIQLMSEQSVSTILGHKKDSINNSIPQANTNGNTNTKYSMQESKNNTNKWQNFLEKNSLNDGTRTMLKQIKLPDLKDAVRYKTENNMKRYSDTINMPIDKILQYKSEGGYRTKETVNKLKEDIKSNGIQNPIELIRDEDGKIKINNGNHRLEIAKQLGLKEIPITYKDYANIDKIDKNMYDANDKDILKYMEDYKYGNNRNSKEIDSINGRSGDKQGNSHNNRIKSKNEGTTGRNDSIYKQTQGIYNGPSNITTSTKDTIQGLEESSSFNLEQKDITRHDIIQENRKIAQENIKNIATWKDKKNGLSYQLETMERNMYDIIPDKKEAKKIIDTYFTPVHEREADKQRFINSYNNKIEELELNKYESEAVQLLGELRHNPSFKVTDEIRKVLNSVNNNIQNDKIDQIKVDTAIEVFRNIYDELFDLENNELRRNGYQEKTYRKGYFPHFIDAVPETKTEKILDKFGFKIDKRSLPTDIAGITEQFVPGKTWNKSALERKTNKTDFNALKGFDTYISQAADNIFHTENIQRLRGLENEIRYQYSEKGIQERIDKILENQSLNSEEKQSLIDQLFEQVENPMPNLVVELRRYTNALANKKSEADRSTEQMLRRSFYSTVNAIENRFAGNAVGLNISSALTNFIPITQAYSQIGSVNMERAMIDTMKSYIKDDGFVNKSTFLTNRLNQSEKLYKTTLEKVSEKTNIPFDLVDSITSNIVVRGKYLENIKNGMSEKEAIKNADSFASSLMADRSKGSLPTKFEEKNPLTKAFTQFQLEVNNQYRYIIKDLPRELAEKGLGTIALAYFKMFISAWIYNKFSEKMTGRKQAFSPIDLIKSSYDTVMDGNLNTYNKIVNIGTEFGEQAPFVGGLLGGGRVPVNGALPNIANVTKASVGLITGEMDSKKALNILGKEAIKPAYYLLPPFGGGQLKKTTEGIMTVRNGGTYGVDKNGEKILKFPVKNPTVKEYMKAGIFGKYALPKAQNYVENDFKSLNAEETKVYEESNVEFETLQKYFDYSKKEKIKKVDKMNYIDTNLKNISENDKWNLYKHNIISSTQRKNGTSQLSDAEYIFKNKMATKSEYIKLYRDAEKNNVEFPDTEILKKLKETNLSLEKYMKYSTDLKKENEKKKIEYEKKLKTMLPVNAEEAEKSKKLNTSETIALIQNSIYTDKEKDVIYSNFIDKEDENYINLKLLNNNDVSKINSYLEYRQAYLNEELESDKKDDGTKNGKAIKGSAERKLRYYLNNYTDFSELEKLYLGGIKHELNNEEKDRFEWYIKNSSLTSKEERKVYKKLKGVVEMIDGSLKW